METEIIEMTTSMITCSIYDVSTESYTYCSYYVPQPINYSKIKDLFPFEGNFHFRLQCDTSLLGITGKDGFVWLDLGPSIDDKIYLNSSKNNSNSLILRALVISAPSSLEDTDLETYFQSSKTYLGALRQSSDGKSTSGFGRSRPAANNSDGEQMQSSSSIGSSNSSSSSSNSSSGTSFLGNLKSVVNTTVNSVKQVAANNVNSSTVQNLSQGITAGATSIWSSVKAATVQLQNTLNINSGSELTDQSEENLAYYSELLATPYSDKNGQHMQLLQDLWNVLFVGSKYQRDSMRWKDAGFQTTDPIADLKTSGLLAMHSAIFLGKTYPQKLQQMLLNNRENIKTKYPLIIVIVNVTMLLADVLKLRNDMYLQSQFNCWELFDEKKSFFEIFSHCVSHVDTVWIERNAVRADFGGIVKEVKELVISVLADAPRSLSEFTQIATHKGLIRSL